MGNKKKKWVTKIFKDNYTITVIMLDLFSKDNITFQIIYKDTRCTFIPNKQVKYNMLPDVIDGHVVYLAEGEYNPSSWLKPYTIKKSSILADDNIDKVCDIQN